MRYVFIILTLLIISCEETPKEEIIKRQNQEISFDPAISQMELRGQAAQFSTTWVAYQKFITELENFDHSPAAAERLILDIEDMKISIPEAIEKQPVKSRLKVLETRVKTYHSLLTHNSYSNKEQQNRFDSLIQALDEFKIQIMESFQLEKVEASILKNLEESDNP